MTTTKLREAQALLDKARTSLYATLLTGKIFDAAQEIINKLRSEIEPTVLLLSAARIELQPGEHYAGPVLDADGNLMHHLVLMAQCPTGKLAWQAATDWAASVGGTLPTRQEQALLFANCKPHLKPEWHWSCETHEDDASYAWHCYFYAGTQGSNHNSHDGSAVAVRRIHVTA